MIQDIQPYKLNNQYQNNKPQAESRVLFTEGSLLLLDINDNNIEFPRFKEVSDKISDMTFLFSINEQDFFLAGGTENERSAAIGRLKTTGYDLYNIKTIRKQNPKWLTFAAATAFQLGKWYENNKFCGKCGHLLRPSENDRAMYCDYCGNIIYPKICPVVIVGVTNGDKILLTKYADREHYDRYALIAGFAEIGETIEETMQREVMEETGVKVRNIRYYKSQPWPFSDSLLFGFFCELDGSDEISMDPGELSVATWVHRKDMKATADDVSLTNEMMVKFKNNLF